MDPKKFWITNRIRRHIAIKDKLYQLWIKTKSKDLYEKCKKKPNEVKMEIKMLNEMTFSPKQIEIAQMTFSDILKARKKKTAR